MARNSGNNAHVTITVDGKQAVSFYRQLEQEERRLASLAKAGDKEAEKEQNKIQGLLTDARKELMAIDDVLKGKVFANLGKLEQMAKNVKLQMRYADSAEELRKLQIQYRGLTDRIRELTNQTQQSSHAFGRLMQRAAEYTGFYMIFNRSQQIIKNAIQGNLQLSDSISDIQKVSGLSEEAVKGLVAQIEKIDSRNSPEVLNNMAYAAGKLGIKGSENLLAFTRAADKVNVALKEYLGDGAEGVVKLMKFGNVMGTTDMYGVEQALLKTGSALNYMTQNTAAAADYMIEFAGRFGPVARQAKMTEGDVIGLASALDALTVNNEEAATSLQKFVLKLLSSPTTVSKALGIDANTAKNMVETGKSIELVEIALGKLGERAEKYGVSGITSVIGDIGSKGQAQRLIKTLATLANNTEMVHDYIVMANGAFEKGTSVIDEYNIKNQNAAAIMERMRNSWQKVLVNSEQVGVVKDLAMQLYNLSTGLQQSTVAANIFKGVMNAVFEVLMFTVRALDTLAPVLTVFLATRFAATIGGWAQSLWAFASALATNMKAIGLYILKLVGLRAAQDAVSLSAMRAAAAVRAFFAQTIIGVAVVALGILLNELMKYIYKQQEASRAMEEFKKEVNNLSHSTEEYNRQLFTESRAMDELFAKAKAANKKTDEKKRLIAEINTKYGKYLSHLLTEKSSIQDIAAAQEEANRKLRENIALKMKEADINKAREIFIKRGSEGLEAVRIGAEGLGLSVDNVYAAQEQIQDLLKKNYGKAGYGGPNQATVSILKELAKEDSRWGRVIANRTGQNQMYYLSQYNKIQGKNVSPTDEGFQRYWREVQSHVDENRKIYQGVYDFVYSIIGMNNTERDINRKYAPMQRWLKESGTEEEGGDGTTEILETGGKTGSGSKVDKEKEQAKKDVQAIKAQLTAFYEWRESEINKMRDEGTITEAVKDLMVNENKSMRAQSEMDAWKYLLGDEGAAEVWKEQLEVMKQQILNSNPEMIQTLEYIGQVNMEKLGNTLKRLGSEEVGGMRKTIAQDAAIIQQQAAKLAQAVQVELDKYDYEKTVRTKFAGALTQMGLFKTQWENGIRDGFENATEAADAAMKGLVALGDKAFQFDINTEEGLEAFRTALSKVSGLALNTGSMTVDQLKLMYLQVIELAAQMDEANKKSYQHLKRQQEMRFKASGATTQEKQTDKSLEMTKKTKDAGIGQTLAEQVGLGSIMEDPELQRIQNRIYWRQQEMQDAKRIFDQKKALQDAELQAMIDRGATEKEIEDLRLQQQRERAGEEALLQERETAYTNEMNNLTIQIATQMKERANSIKKLITPVTDFTQAAGKKIGDMIFDMESEEASWEELWKNMALAVAESVIQMGQQYAQNLIMQQMMAKQSEAVAIEEAEVGTMAGIAEGSAKTIGKLGWWGIPLVAVISALLMGLLQSALSTKKKADSSSSTSSKTNSSLRLVKGMLTYDEGNVQTFQQAKEGGAYTVLGTDGRVYSAHKQNELPTGIVRRPTATLVNGQPSLVAERGPELIVGRKTLRAMTQFRPDLVDEIVKFDHNRRHGFRLYDEGNLMELGMSGLNGQPNGSATPAENNTALLAALQDNQATNEKVLAVLTALTTELHKGIGVRKYGTGGLVEEVIDGLYTTKKRNTSPMLRRLLGNS